MKPLSIPPKTRGKYRVGDRVRIVHGWGGVIAEVIEDIGNLGKDRFYTLRFKLGDQEMEMPCPEDELEPVSK
jgi:hypothetical protein